MEYETIFVEREELLEVSEETARFFEENVGTFDPIEGSRGIAYKHECVVSDAVLEDITFIKSWLMENMDNLDCVEIPEEAEGFEATCCPEPTEVYVWDCNDLKCMEALKQKKILVSFCVSVEGTFNNEEEEED